MQSFINRYGIGVSGEVERRGSGPATVDLMSLLSDWQVAIEKPALGPNDILDFCPKCTRLLAIGNIASVQHNVQIEEYNCTGCGFSFTKWFYKR